MASKVSMQEWSDDLTLILKEELGISILELLDVVDVEALQSFYNDGYSPPQTILLITMALREAEQQGIVITKPQSYKWLHQMYLNHKVD